MPSPPLLWEILVEFQWNLALLIITILKRTGTYYSKKVSSNASGE
jgi:hypothetical protein